MSIILRVGAVKPLNRSQDTQYGSGDEASASYTDADVLDIPLPEHTYQRPLPAVFSQPQNNTSYFGLPYQDHNYGMPPPPSPPRPPTPDPPSPLQVNGVVQMEEEVKTSPMVSVVEEVVEDSITRCICGYLHDDGYMICCDKCSVWQHIDCMGVDRNNIPDSYFCELCQPRVLDAVRAKTLQKKKREELAARNVLSDSSATDTDPEEAANALASMVKKVPVTKRKGLKQRRNTKTKEKQPPLKLKIGKAALQKKIKKSGKKEKENIKAIKSKKVFKPGVRKLKEIKSRPLMVNEYSNTDPWDSTASPWVDEYEIIQASFYSEDVLALCHNKVHLFKSGELPAFLPNQLRAQLVCMADVKKNRKGLKAVDQILAGQGIIEYTGRVMLKHEYDQQYALHKSATLLQPFVLFHSNWDVVFCVDATSSGNESRFVRRSCTPNAEVQMQYGERKIHFVILAKKDISSGVEVTIPFDYDYHISTTCIECACLRTNCVISRFWKKKKKSQQKEITCKRRRQSSGGDSKKVQQDQLQKMSSPQSSPRKASSPGRSLSCSDVKSPPATTPTKIGSPIRLSVSTLLAASALLEAQSEATTVDFNDGMKDTYQSPPPHTKPVTSPLPKNVTSMRRGSKASEDLKEEKSTASSHLPNATATPKEKVSKVKETKNKVKENKDLLQSPVPVEVKKERRLSYRRQSQEETVEEKPHIKEEVTPGNDTDKEESAAEESYRKMTREERKLDAIMKAFEKMEKREERRKEAIARGEGSTKKPPELKGKKRDDQEETEQPRTRSVSQESSVDDEVKVEVEEPSGKSPPVSNEVKEIPSTPAPASQHQLSDVPVTEEPTSQRPPRKVGKRKRRRSRVQTAPPLTDSLPPLQDESSTSSTTNTQIQTPYIPPAPVSAPVQSCVESVEAEGEEFKYVKTKKHLFNEWSHKHDDETSKQEEMFVQCLPSPRVNAMDHLQRRNSHSAGCNRVSESGGGFAKKRWLRQAMHEEPAPLAFNHNLSVSTENGSASPIYGSISPNNAVNLSSPGASSPLDFVTPLKKRRLMRESLSTEGNNGPVHSPGQGLLSEPVAMDVPRSNGLKSFLPAHRLSVDDRLLLHKSYPHHNGYKEVSNTNNNGLFKKTANSTPSSVSVCLKFDSVHPKSEETETGQVILTNGLNHKVSNITTAASSSSDHLVNGFSSTSDCITSVSLSPSRSSSSQLVTPLRSPYESMEIDSSGDVASDKESRAKVYSSEETRVSSLTPLSSNINNDNTDPEESSELDNSSVSRRVVVNSVYNGVNNLMDNSSEAGCVVTKSIMEADGPATVCVDLNVHEMEPSSLAGGSKTTVVDLDKELFTLDSDQKEELPETLSDCQVNSSEEISSNIVPLRLQGQAPNCDNPTSGSPTNSQVSVVDILPLQVNHQIAVCENSDSSTEKLCRSRDVEKPIDQPNTSSIVSCDSPKHNLQTISSSSHTSAIASDSRTSAIVCDSAEALQDFGVMEVGVEMPVSASVITAENSTGQCDSGSGVSPRRCETESELELTNGHDRSCDSAGNISILSDFRGDNMSVDESADPSVNVTESCDSRCEQISVAEDANVDSTSSEPVQERFSVSQSFENANQIAQGNITSFCDSNSERDLNGSVVERENLSSMYDSSSEEVGVSSSSAALQSQHCNPDVIPWGEDECTESIVREAVPGTDTAISDTSPLHASSISYSSPGSIVSSNSGNNITINSSSSVFESPVEDCSSSSVHTSTANGNSTVNSSIVSSNTVSTTPSQHSAAASSMSSPPPFLSSLSQDEFAASSMVSTSCTSDLDGTTPTTTSSAVSPSGSTSEAIPAVKKKVSLLEYRMRLKKPATTASETKASSTSPVSLPCTIVTLSSVCEKFLSSSPSSSSMGSYSTSSSSSSSVTSPHKKHNRMPTLATLPLFKSTEKKGAEEKKLPREKKAKQLSLNERLRLEFGLDDSAEDSKTKSDLSAAVDSSSGKDEAIPPPPPPPPPPSRSYPYSATSKTVSRPSSGFSAAVSSIPSVSYAAPLVNGGLGSSSHSLPQQANISSTSVSSHHMREGNNNNIINNYPPPPQPRPNPSQSTHQAGINSFNTAYQPLPTQPQSQTQTSISSSSSSSLSSSSSSYKHIGPSQWPPPPHHHHHHHQVPSPVFPPSASSSSSSSSSNTHSQPSSTSSLPPPPQPSSSIPPPLQPHHHHHTYSDFFHVHSTPPSQSAQAVVSGNTIADDNPPPPPPPPPLPRTHPHHHSSSSSLTSHRHSSSSSTHRRHDSSDRNKKAASSSSSSHYSDKRGRY